MCHAIRKDDAARSGRLKQRILKLHTASKVEDLPQLIIASIFLVHRSVFLATTPPPPPPPPRTSSGAVGAAIVQLVVSGVSFALTLLWLGLQINDLRYAKIRGGLG